MKYVENEKFAQQIRECGQSLIDNAENMVDYKYLQDMTINCRIFGSGCPYIEVKTRYYPEKFIERLNKGV